jgi:hypothetical protein
MNRLKVILMLVFLAGFSGLAASAQQKPFIDWKNLKNPILSYPDWSIKDTALAYRDGTFYVFFSAFYPSTDDTVCHVVEVTTKDFKHFSEPLLKFDGKEDGWIGMCSPDVELLNGQYVMTFNSWGNQPTKPNQLFYMTSSDLIHWSKREKLAPNLTEGKKVIDAALAYEDGGYYALWKQGPKGGSLVPRVAFSKSLEGPYEFVGDGLPKLLRPDGSAETLTHENYQFMKADGKWFLLTTDYDQQKEGNIIDKGEELHLYTLDPTSHWLTWGQGRRLDTPQEAFNTDYKDNAGCIIDWRQYDGYFYLLYAGRTEYNSFAMRGLNRLGLARSKDLIHWSPAGHAQ